MRLLVTGASGMLGSEFVLIACKQGHEVAVLTRSDCDVTIREDVLRYIERTRPEVIVHCAAHTDVDDCERNPGNAYLINAESPGYFAVAARRLGCCLLYVSSCGIFDGKKAGAYTEEDLPAPLTHYSRSKLEGEKNVIQSGCEYLILRAGWLFGGDPYLKKNFVAARKREAEKDCVIHSAVDKQGSPTWTRDFAYKALELLSKKVRGLFHVANNGLATRFDYVSEIVSLFDLPTTVEPVDSSRFVRSAHVPDNEALTSIRLPVIGVAGLRSWSEALKEYISELRATAR